MNLKNLLNLIIIASLAVFITACGKKQINPYALLQSSIEQALNKGNWKEAKTLSWQAMKADPENLDAKIMYSLTLEQSGEQTEAIKNLKDVINKSPKNFIAQLTLGRILFDMQDYEGAYEYLSNAYNLDTDNLDALLMYAQCSSKLLAQNTDKLLLKLSNVEPYKGKPVIFNELAVYYAKTGNIKSAIENLVKAYKISPDNPTIVLNLGVLCDQYMKQPAKAKFFYNKFIELTNNNPAYNQQRQDITKRLTAL